MWPDKVKSKALTKSNRRPSPRRVSGPERVFSVRITISGAVDLRCLCYLLSKGCFFPCALSITHWPRSSSDSLQKYSPGGIDALQPIDLTINRGELLVVLGPSGSGKSTLLRLIAGLDSPTRGVSGLTGKT